MLSLLDVKQAAAQLSMSTSYLYVLVDRREIACYRYGARIRFTEEQLAEYLQRQLQAAAPAADGVR